MTNALPITAESEGEIILKIGQHCRSYGQESKWVFFSEHSIERVVACPLPSHTYLLFAFV